MSSSSFSGNRLPVEVLSRVFVHTLFDEDQEGWQNGGELVGWDSHGQATNLARVCRDWNGPATQLLYQAVDIRGGRAAERFLETMRSRPELLALVRSVVVGLGELEEVADGSMGQVSASLTVMDALEVLTTVDRLQIRPLHVAIAQRLATHLARLPPRALVLSERLVLPSPQWSHGLFDHFDWSQILSQMKELDVDWDQELSAPLPEPVALPRLRMQRCRLRVPRGLPQSFYHLFESMRDEDMRVLRIYTEQRLSPKKLAASLSHLSHLRHLRYIINPPLEHLPPPDSSPSPPFIDLLIPHLQRLETIDVSANDLTSHLFNHIPTTLTTLKISVFNAPDVNTCPTIAGDVRTRPHSLQQLTLVDSKARWKPVDLEELEQACKSREVNFTFIDDDLCFIPTSSPSAGSTSVSTDSSGNSTRRSL